MARLNLSVLPLAFLLAAPAFGQSVDPDDAPQAPANARAAPNADSDETPKKPKATTEADDQDEEEGGQQTGAIVVTARRLDTARTSIDQGLGATVYSLNNDAIENRPGGETGSVGAILTQTRGVTLSSSGLNIRGSSALQVRINDAIIPEAISDPADRLSSRLAETTRLITGTLPAQFGFAPGGVIAITTKNGLYQHGGQIELFGGNHGALEPAFEWGGSADSTSLFASGSLERGDSRVADLTGASAKDRRHDIGGLAFADHVIDPEDRVSLIVGGSHERHWIGATSLPAGTEQNDDGNAVGTFQHSNDRFTLQASLFAGASKAASDFAVSERERRSSTGTQIDSSLELGGGHTLKAGLLLNHSTSREDAIAPTALRASRTSLGLYAQDEWKPDPRLTINVGLRGDWLRRVGSAAAVEPRASVVWTGGNGFTAHAGYARYASAPPLGEEPAGTPLPNERDDYLDAGAQQKLGPVTIGLDAYSRTTRNLIVEHQVPGQAIPTTFEFQRGRFRGVELSATYARGPFNAWANVSLAKSQGRTLVGGANIFTSSTVAGADDRWLDLAGSRPLTVSGGIGWRIGNLNLSGDVLAGSGAVRTLSATDPNGARASNFVSLGLSAVYHLKLWDKPLDVRADLTNLTNAHYLENDAANLEGGWTRFAQGRSVLVGFEQSF